MFTVAWGNKWSNHYSQSRELAASITKEWSELLTTLTSEQIEKAYSACKYKCEWFPSIAEFRNAALGILPASQAWILAKNGEYDNAIVERARKSISSWDWQNKDEKDLRRDFIDTYNLIVDRL